MRRRIPAAWIDGAFRIRRRVLALLRWRTRGVKVAVFDAAGAVLLVRHRYGDSAAFILLGGGVKAREAPATAAAREIREELGCDLADIALIGTYLATAEGRRDTVYLYRATIVGTPTVDGVELAEARFFALDDLPPATSPATRRRLAEIAGHRPIAAAW